MTTTKLTTAFRRLTAALAVTALACVSANAQKVYSTDYEYQADVKVFVVDKSYRADLIVYRVKHEYQAKGNKGLWFFVDKAYQADKKIYFTDKEYQADLKIYFTDREYRAGWEHKKYEYLMY